MKKHQKNYILRDINYIANRSISTLANFVYALAQKLVGILKLNFSSIVFSEKIT